jgi:protein involved in polysaccharide export with SLBB domain
VLLRIPAQKFIGIVCILSCSAVVAHGQGEPVAPVAPVAPGDRFVIRAIQPEGSAATGLTEQYILIDDRYTVTVPPAAAVSVRGLGPHEAMDSVRARLARFLRPDAYSVAFQRRIAVLGEVRRPDLHYVDLTMRLRDAIAAAGGVPESGKSREVMLIRHDSVERILDWRTTASGDRELQSGDQIVVPRESWYRRNALPLVSAVGVLASVLITLAR